MTTFVTSDTHFGHTNIIKYCSRPFSTDEEMDAEMVRRWNSVVKHNDKVYHLGDVYMSRKGNTHYMDHILGSLNGTKVLILGNHDAGKDQLLLKHFKRIYMWRFLKEYGLLLSHVPVHESSLSHKLKLNVHGHTHEKGSPKGPYASACVELHDYTPIDIQSFVR